MPSYGTARAFWIEAETTAGFRPAAVDPGPGDVVVATRYSGISRGTEALVFRGGVPRSEHARMRAPLQEGQFPFPVKYGYAAVGKVISGPADLADRMAFVLHPHQDRFAAPAGMAIPLPAGVPPRRAVLAANAETALNIVWDAGIGPGDRVAVVGAGVVGALAGWIAARIPEVEVTLVDVNETRAGLANALGCSFALPGKADGSCDVVIHASASGSGLATALELAGREACVVEASWYGDRPVEVVLGAHFHSQRLRLVASQVGSIPPTRSPRWTHRRRLETALALLVDPSVEALISGETSFADLPESYGEILRDPDTLCHLVRYE